MSSNVEKENAYSREYAETLSRIARDEYCPFCWVNLKREHGKPILYQTKNWLVTENQFSYKDAAVKLLVIYRHHVNEILEIPNDDLLELFELYKGIIRDKSLEGCTLLSRQGNPKMTGATVRHFHLHILAGDGNRESEAIMARVG